MARTPHGWDFPDPSSCAVPDVRELLAVTRRPAWALQLTPVFAPAFDGEGGRRFMQMIDHYYEDDSDEEEA